MSAAVVAGLRLLGYAAPLPPYGSLAAHSLCLCTTPSLTPARVRRSDLAGASFAAAAALLHFLLLAADPQGAAAAFVCVRGPACLPVCMHVFACMCGRDRAR